MHAQKLFDRYNRRFWRGKLRGWAVTEVHLYDVKPAGEFGDCCNETREIAIQIGLPPVEKRKTLLHEMRLMRRPWQKSAPAKKSRQVVSKVRPYQEANTNKSQDHSLRWGEKLGYFYW